MRVHRGTLSVSATLVALSSTQQLAEGSSVGDLARWVTEELAGGSTHNVDARDDADDEEPEVDLSDDFFESAQSAKRDAALPESGIDWHDFTRFLSQNNNTGNGFQDLSTNASEDKSSNETDAFSGGQGCTYDPWSAWSDWGPCQVHTGQGAGTKQKKTRSRTESFGSTCNPKTATEDKFKDCVVDPCASAYGQWVDGTFGACTAYTGTTETWQFSQQQTRTRSSSVTGCDATSETVSQECTPTISQADTCTWKAWGAWSSYGTCTVNPSSLARKQTRSRNRDASDDCATGEFPAGAQQELEHQMCQTECASGDASCIVSDKKCAAQGTTPGQCNRLWLGTASNRGNCFWDATNAQDFAKRCRHASLAAQDVCQSLTTQAACEAGLARDLEYDSAKGALKRSSGVLCHWDNIEDKCGDKTDQASAPVCKGTVTINGQTKNLDTDAVACQGQTGNTDFPGREFNVLGAAGPGTRSCRALGVEIDSNDNLKSDKCVPVSAAKKLLPAAAVKTITSTSEQKTAIGGNVAQLMSPTDVTGLAYDAAAADPTSTSPSFDMMFAKTLSDARKTALDTDLGIVRTPKTISRTWGTARRGRALAVGDLDFGVATEVAIKIVNTATDGSVKLSKKDTLLLGVATGTVSPAAFVAVQEEEKAKVASMTGESSTAKTLSMTKEAAPSTVFGNKEVALVSLGGFADAVAQMDTAAKTAAVASLNTALTSAGKSTVQATLVDTTSSELADVKVLAKKLTGAAACDADCKADLAGDVNTKLAAVPGIDVTKIAAVPAASIQVAGLGVSVTVTAPTVAKVEDVSDVSAVAAPTALAAVQESAADDVFAAAATVPPSQVAAVDAVCGYKAPVPVSPEQCGSNNKKLMKQECEVKTAANANGNPVCTCTDGEAIGAFKTDPTNAGTGAACGQQGQQQQQGGGGDSGAKSGDSAQSSSSTPAAPQTTDSTDKAATPTSGAAGRAGLLASAVVAATLCL